VDHVAGPLGNRPCAWACGPSHRRGTGPALPSGHAPGQVPAGDLSGQPVRRLRSAATATSTGRRSARFAGFSLHADVAVLPRRRDELEKVCRYILRPPLAVERLTESPGGQLLYQFRRPWRWLHGVLLDPLSCWGAWRPSCRRRADLCWPTRGSPARGRAGDRPSCRRHRRPTHGETWTRAPRGAGPGSATPAGVRR
jgi:hypothetical protein